MTEPPEPRAASGRGSPGEDQQFSAPMGPLVAETFREPPPSSVYRARTASTSPESFWLEARAISSAVLY
jgi:hypothetical protein